MYKIPKTKKEALKQLAEDLALKLSLEVGFSSQLRRIFRGIGYDFAGNFIKTGSILNLAPYKTDLVGIIRENYRKISNKFGYRLVQVVDSEKQITNEQREMLFDTAISDKIKDLSEVEADLILETTNNNLNEDLKQVLTESAIAGTLLSNTEIAELTRKKFVENSLVRSDIIAETETQTMAELSKQTEFDIFAETEATLEGVPLNNALDKIWLAVMDSKTRPAHADADGQRVNVNDSFLVGGEFMSHPGDPNASAENRINCRCGSEFIQK